MFSYLLFTSNDISQKQGSKKTVNKLKQNENNKEYIDLGEGEYRGDYFLSDNCSCLATDDNIPYDNNSDSRPMPQTRLTQKEIIKKTFFSSQNL